MSQITISMPENLDKEIRREAEKGGYSSVSAYITEIIRRYLTNDHPLDYWTRVQLAVALENNKLLSTLTKGQELISDFDWSHSRALGVIEDGITFEYDDIFLNVDRNELTRGAAKYVIHVLAMYEDMQLSAERLELEDLKSRLAFPGFDGNHEGELLGYVRHLVNNRRFAHIAYQDPSFNSHGMEPHYKGMLERYNHIRDEQKRTMEYEPLSEAQLRSILGR